MVSRKPTVSKPKPKGTKPARASAVPPQTSATRRPLADAAPATPKSGRAQQFEVADDGTVPLKKQELIATVVERSDVPKKYAKPVVEAMLAVLGEALGEGRDLNLQPMGKIKRKRMKDTGKARVIVANIRQPNAPGAGDDALVRPAAAVHPQGGKDQAKKRGKEAVADDAE
ncbi:HU family DNA-binding protein [Roseovarius sp. M141]|uniref:HU family DNA-binding protein n=1 Tax=Roseovarius sp. M141 TaxID=2583806 RepID=UPI0020CE33CD|nr:HU family DNA-binding protein [Roseovarius sp. M141]MCQ0093210.1 HU family DNA-binding protein [Roseovarius sp. M141]